MLTLMVGVGSYTSGAFALAILLVRLWVYRNLPRSSSSEEDPITLDLKPVRLPFTPIVPNRLFTPERYPQLPVQTLAALWFAGLMRPEELPELASTLLGLGRDSPHLRQLAGSDGNSHRDLDELAASAFAELGADEPLSWTQARDFILRQIASDVISGSLSPQQAVDKIAVMNDMELTEDQPGQFVRLSWEYEAALALNPLADTTEIDRAVRDLCWCLTNNPRKTTQPGQEPG